MAYAKTTWKNRVVQNPNTYLQQQNADGTVTLVPKEGTVTEAGTPVNAVNMNHIEDGISSIDAANSIYSAGGTANAITVTTANGDYSYAQFKKLSIKAASNNTGNVTINVDSKGAVPALKYDKSQLPAGAIKAGKVYDFYYDTTNTCFFLIAKASGNTVAAHVLAGDTCSTDMGDVVGTMDLKSENIRKGVNYAGIVGNLSPRNNVEYIYVKNGYYLRSPFFADDNWFESIDSTDNLYKMNINGTIIQTVSKPTSLGGFLTASKNHILTYNSPGRNGLALCNTSGTLLKSISGITLNVTNAYIDEDNSRVIIYNNATKAVEVYDFDLNLLASKSLNVDEIVIFIPMAYYVLIYTDAESEVNLLSKSNTFTRYLMYLDESLVF